MTSVAVTPSATCDGIITVLVSVEADASRGPWALELYGTTIKGGSVKGAGGGVGSGGATFVFTGRTPGTYTIGATASFANGGQPSSTPLPIASVTVPGACEVTTTTSTVAPTTTTRIEPTTTTTVVTDDGGPVFPSTTTIDIPGTVARTTTIASIQERPRLPETGITDASTIVPGAVGLIVLGCIALRVQKWRAPK